MTTSRMLGAAALAVALAAIAFLGGGGTAAAQVPDLVSHDQLRICADPNDLPLSNDKGEGFENKIATIIGQELKVPVTYVWFPQIGGFVRRTLKANRCDLVMGSVAGDEAMENTNSYYHSGYMLVSRTDANIATDEIGPGLAGKKIGLIAATPPTDLLIKQGMMNQVTSYALVVDTRFDSPSREMMQDVVDGKLDVGLLWGPFAGYYIKHDKLPLKAVFLKSDGNVRLDFRVSMGVRAGDGDWRRRIDQVIQHHQDDIQKILVDYGIPMLDEQNRPIQPATAAP